nr:hypothetical protein [Tanacetum cinerariifolium]
MVAGVKLLVLNPNEFELCKIRIEQYFLMIDYALWEVILNGESSPLTKSVNGVETPYPPTTVKEKLVRKNELKARECSSYGGLYTRDCFCLKGSVVDKVLVPKPPKNYARCAKCGHPINGPYCQGCSLLREKLEEDLVTYLKYFQDTSESSDDSTNVVNAPRVPVVVKQDHGVNPPHINECCCKCGNALDGIFCQQCIYKSCGKVLIQRAVSTKKIQYLAFQNLTLLMNLPTFSTHLHNFLDILVNFVGAMLNVVTTVHLKFHLSVRSQVTVKTLTSRKIFTIFKNSIPVVISVGARTKFFNAKKKLNRYSFFETPKVLLLAWDRVFEIKDALGTKQYKPEDLQELFRELSNDVQNIHEELAEYINTPGWNRPAFYDDDDDVDYTIAITPVLSTENPIDSLSMGDKHLDTIPTTRSDEVIKSSVEDLIPIPSESEDDILREKLLNVNRLITKIEAFNDNPTPSSDCKTKSSSTSLNSLLEETNTFHNSLPEFEKFYFDLGEISSGSTTTHSDISLSEYDSFIFDLTHEEFADELTHIISPPEYDCFYFWNLLDPGELMSVLNSGICENLSFTTRVNLLVEDDYSPLLAYVLSSIPENLKTLAKGFYPPSLNFLSFNGKSCIQIISTNVFLLALLTKSSFTSPKSFLEETNTFHNSLPKFENFYFDLEEISSGSTTTDSNISLLDYEAFYFDDDHVKEINSGSPTTQSDISFSEYDSFIFDLTHKEFADELTHIISPPEYDCFYFRNLPNPGELISIFNSGIRENLSTTSVNLPIEDDHSSFLAYVVWIFLSYLTYPAIPPYLHPFGNEDTIFDPSITINRVYSFKPGLSRRCRAFKKLNTHRSHLNEWPMIINGKNIPNLDVLLLLHLAGSQPMLKSSYKAEASVIISIPPLVGGVADVVVKIKGTGADNRPPMLEKDMYDSWKSRMELYMLNRPNGRMILESVEQGPLIWPTVEVEGVTRLKKYSELSAAEAIQADCDVKATNIILQGLPPEVYALVSTHKVAKELWERIQMLMQGTSLTKQERECKLYDAFDKFAYQKGETLREIYLRFSLLLNDMNIYDMKLEQFQVNTKFLNTLPSEWTPQIAYAQMDQQSSEYSPPEAGLVVPVFQKGDDPIDAINHM